MGAPTRVEFLAAILLGSCGAMFVLAGMLLPIGYAMAESDNLALLGLSMIALIGLGALLL